MPQFTQVDDRKWQTAQSVGHTLERCMLWNQGEGVSAALWRMPREFDLGAHRHDTWVSVFVIEGSIRHHDGTLDRTLGPGDFYFVEPHDTHQETSLEESVVLIIKAEPAEQYPVDELDAAHA